MMSRVALFSFLGSEIIHLYLYLAVFWILCLVYTSPRCGTDDGVCLFLETQPTK